MTKRQMMAPYDKQKTRQNFNDTKAKTDAGPTLFPYIPAIPRLIVCSATSRMLPASEALMKTHVKSPTRFWAWTTIYGESAGIATRTAWTSLSYQRRYRWETLSDMSPLEEDLAFFLPKRSVSVCRSDLVVSAQRSLE
jgi:hypothetical protein